jgi:hypothetical protein
MSERRELNSRLSKTNEMFNTKKKNSDDESKSSERS